MTSWLVPGHLEFVDGSLRIDNVDTLSLAQQYGTPLFVFSEQRIRHNIQEIKSAFQGINPRTSIFYASKANSNLAILQIIKEEGLNVEVNSGGELYKALQTGFGPEQIIFNGVAKTEQEIREAIENEIFCINVDSPIELARIIVIAKRLGKKASVALRMVPEIEIDSHGGFKTGTHKTKFGISEDSLFDCYCEALRHPEHLNLIALHIHIGSQVTSAEKYKLGFKTLVTKASELYQKTGYCVSCLNFGGGIPVSYAKQGDKYLRKALVHGSQHQFGDLHAMLMGSLSIVDIAAATLGQLTDEAFLQELDSINPSFRKELPNIRMIIEPGRRIVGNAAILLTTIQNYKTRPATDDIWLLLDAGFHTLFDAFAYNWYFQPVAITSADNPISRRYKLAGPLCDSGDEFHDTEGLGRLPDYYMLPANIELGDKLAFLDVGAYALELMSQYNGQQRAAALLISNSEATRVIRRRDTYEDLIRHDMPLKP